MMNSGKKVQTIISTAVLIAMVSTSDVRYGAFRESSSVIGGRSVHLQQGHNSSRQAGWQAGALMMRNLDFCL